MQFNQSKLTLAILGVTTPFVYAQEASTQLDLIQVVESNTGAKSKTNVVTLKDIQKSNATDLKGLLKNEPSIGFGSGNGTSQWITLRGWGQDQIDIKIDNAYSDAQMFHHQGRFTLIDPTLIKRIDVQKGAGSASAGIGATSGSISVTTVDAKDLLKDGQDVGFKVNGTYSSNKGWSEGGSVFGRYGNVDALISGNWVTNQEYKAGNGYLVKNSGLDQRGLLGKIGIDITPEHRVVLSHRQERHYGERNLREEFDFAQSNNEANNSPSYRVTSTDTTNLAYTGKNLGFVSRVDMNASHMVNARETYGTTRSKVRIVTDSANINLDSPIGENHMIKYGVNYRHQEAKPATKTYATHNQEKTDSAAYVEGIWGLGTVTLTTGARYDHFKFRAMDGKEVSDGKLNPSVGLIWEALDGLSFNASHNYATRSPRFYEAQLASGATRGRKAVYSVANNLKAEHARNTEVGFNYRINENFEVNGSYFWQTIQHLQNSESVGNGVYNIYNSGTLKNNGYEVGASYRIEGLTLRAGVAHSKPKLEGTTYDAVVTAVPVGRTWTTGIAYEFVEPSVELGWNGRFVESSSYDTATNNRGGGTTTNKRAGYGVSDFYINWKPTSKDNLNINVALNNAFNKYYYSHSQRHGTNSLPATGREFTLGMNYTF
ncbi:TonB-dependent receptor domain-containing protein [Actinobacillus vicugnae]|uniref:TonB-dependent receptor domain-containing protein n=1 Tax=Actinobacillus vicugnae TaxID=2573093 RepID=UPI00123FB55E|nr:TonB-dependent receptor [Actinobacillus vicugnae]